MIRIVCIGKMKDKALHMLEEEYIKRLKAFSKVEVVEVRDEPNERIEREKEAAIAKEKEGERALAQIKDSDLVITALTGTARPLRRSSGNGRARLPIWFLSSQAPWDLHLHSQPAQMCAGSFLTLPSRT